MWNELKGKEINLLTHLLLVYKFLIDYLITCDNH